ncbi:MAG: hypothetical protein ACREOI_34220, partial [bacterium]
MTGRFDHLFATKQWNYSDPPMSCFKVICLEVNGKALDFIARRSLYYRSNQVKSNNFNLPDRR